MPYIVSSLIKFSYFFIHAANTETGFSSRTVLIASAAGNGVLITTVLIILLIKYKPRRKAEGLSTSAKNSIEAAVETTHESLPNDQVSYSQLRCCS